MLSFLYKARWFQNQWLSRVPSKTPLIQIVFGLWGKLIFFAVTRAEVTQSCPCRLGTGNVAKETRENMVFARRLESLTTRSCAVLGARLLTVCLRFFGMKYLRHDGWNCWPERLKKKQTRTFYAIQTVVCYSERIIFETVKASTSSMY